MKEEKTLCAHAVCDCEVQGGVDYCSDYCQDPEAVDYDQPLEHGSKQMCGCGHAECGGHSEAEAATEDEGRPQWDA